MVLKGAFSRGLYLEIIAAVSLCHVGLAKCRATRLYVLPWWLLCWWQNHWLQQVTVFIFATGMLWVAHKNGGELSSVLSLDLGVFPWPSAIPHSNASYCTAFLSILQYHASVTAPYHLAVEALRGAHHPLTYPPSLLLLPHLKTIVRIPRCEFSQGNLCQSPPGNVSSTSAGQSAPFVLAVIFTVAETFSWWGF